MFIDEAYSLGSSTEKSDSFSKECLDTLMQNLSEHAGKFVVIIAGYATELDKLFFASNLGLRRRFPFCYTIDNYNDKELSLILQKKVNDYMWKFDNNLNFETINKFIKSNYKKFTHFAGDIETLIFHIKIAHGYRIFGLDPLLRKIITYDDLTNGFYDFIKCKNESIDNSTNPVIYSMYS